MREIVLYTEKNQCHAALIEDGALCEYHVYERDHDVSLAGTILKGRVDRIVPGMDAAFIQLGLEKNGFLPLKEVPGFTKKSPVKQPLQTGQEILVQVKKDPSGDKGAYLTRDITFPGTYVIYLPLDSFVGVSQRVKNDIEREELLKLAHELVPEGTGLVMRSSALHVDQESIRSEIATLQEAWQHVQDNYPQKNAPHILYQNPDPFRELIRDYPVHKIDRVITNQMDLKIPGISVSYSQDANLLMVFGITSQVEKALNRKVWLKSGGFLVIDICEAMTVIDVNSGKFTGTKLLEETIFKLNKEACAEVARQIRLRGLGGILLIDFIDMQSEQHRQAVLETLQSELSKDRVKTVVHGFTSLGIMECTRKKTRIPLHQVLTDQCPRCMGSGRIRMQQVQKGDTSHG